MQHLKILLLLVCFCFINQNTKAQEEKYDEPIRIVDTLYNENSTEETTNSKKENTKEKEDALSALEKKKELLNRLRIGGNFGLQFGNYTYINLSPTVGYMAVKNRLEVGAGAVLIFERFRITNNFALSSFVYGADIYTRGFLYKGLYLEARYDPLYKTSYYNIDRKLWVHHLLLGAGYASSIGKIGVFNVSLLFNVLDNDESVYRGTFSSKFPLIFNVGFGFGAGGRK